VKHVAVLEAVELAVGYARHVPLFRNLNLRLHAGELVCFMGANGAGKSTLLRTLAGLQTPLSGHVSLSKKKDVAVVLTEKVPAGHMMVHELLAFGRYPYLGWKVRLSSTDSKIIEQTVNMLNLQSLLNKQLYELSDGQAQMVMVARALIQQTSIILLDEPTAHLDLNNRMEMMNLLRRLARLEGKAILVATHELDLALQTADRLWLATNDRIITGIPEDLVLNGALDNAFKFKGYDLKTGKVLRESFRTQRVKVHGKGHLHLWTKNALERAGFVVSDTGDYEVHVKDLGSEAGGKTFDSMEKLLSFLTRVDERD